LKILLVDIETAPHLGHVWALWDQNVGLPQLIESGYILCWAAKWVGEPEIFFASKHNSTKKQMLKKIHKLLDVADVVVTYNGNRFDLPTLNAEFAEVGMFPPAPAKSFDLLKVVKSKFRLPSYKLEYVVKYFGVGKKLKNSGHELWVRCMANDPAAWAEMEQYNVHDTVLLEGLFEKLKPWIKGLLPPDHSGDLSTCRSCGSSNLHRRGFSFTHVSKFQRYQCQDCGSWGRSGANEISTETRKNILRPL